MKSPTWFALFSSSRTTRRRRAVAARNVIYRRRLMCELLEDRRVLSEADNPAGIDEGDDSDLINMDYVEGHEASFDEDTHQNNGQKDDLKDHGGPIHNPKGALDSLANNNTGASGTVGFTQSETSLVAFGNTILIGFNDSGSYDGTGNKFTGFSRSTDGGFTFADGGTLPTNANGDAGDPVLARDNTTGRMYFATLVWSNTGLNVFHSDDNGATWSAPTQGAPGKGSSQDKEWIAVDNNPGAGNGNVYLVERDFGSGNGIFFFRSTDHGGTFGPSNGTQIVAGNQGAFVTVGPDHSVYVFWYAGSSIMMRKSTDQGQTFGNPVTVISNLTGGTNGDLGLTGTINGSSTPSGFRSNEFPHAAVNPISGAIYVTYNNKGVATGDKADVFVVQSTNGGTSFGSPIKVNDDTTNTDQWQPTLAVSPDGTRLGIFYYSRQEDPTGDNVFKYYGRVAAISGSTLSFTPSFAVSDTPSLPEFGRDAVVNSVYMGDYNQAVATPGYFHVSWSDNRSDLSGGGGRKDPNVYYKKIPVGLAVASSTPAPGDTEATVRTDFTVKFTDPINQATLQASDFTVTTAGSSTPIPADSYAYDSVTNTATFHYGTSPVTMQGIQTMKMADGAVTRFSDGSALLGFSAPFRFDQTALQVDPNNLPSPAPGSRVTLDSLSGNLTYTVNFADDNLLDPASVDPSDLILSVGTVTSPPIVNGLQVTYTITGLTREGTLNVTIPAGAVTDSFGNPSTSDFTASYTLDYDTSALPTPFVVNQPLGSLVYSGGTSAIIDTLTDTDSFTFNVDPGQTITVRAAGGTVQPTIILTPPSDPPQSASSAAVGKAAVLETVPASGGIYTVTIGSLSGTGAYLVSVILNAARELENNDGPTNDTTATAQNVDGAFLTMHTSVTSADRAAVVGATDQITYTSSSPSYSFEDISNSGTKILQSVNDSSVNVALPFAFPFYRNTYTSVNVSSNGLLTFDTDNSSGGNGDLSNSLTQAAIAPLWDDLNIVSKGATKAAVIYQVVGTGAAQHLVVQWNNVSYAADSPQNGGLTFEAVLNLDGSIRFNYKTLNTGKNGGAADGGKSATVGVKEFGSGVLTPNLLQIETNGIPPGQIGNNSSLLLTPNGAPDYYSFTLNPGDITTLDVKPTSTIGYTNLQLLSSAGTVVATGAPSGVNLGNVIANYAPAGLSGPTTFYARVTGGSKDTYSLVITRNAALESEPNETLAKAQDISSVHGVLGYIDSSTTLTLGAIDSGWWDNTGAHSSGNKNYLVGLSGNTYRNFFVFDLSAVTQQITSANFVAFNPSNGFASNSTSETYSLFDVLTSLTALRGVGTGLTSIYNDLGSGTSYASRAVTSADNGTNISIPLNASALSYLNASKGTQAAFGGAITTISGTANQYVFAYTGGGGQLVLTVDPPADWYSVKADSLGNLHVETSTPGAGPGEFANGLNPHIDLYNASGVLIASGISIDSQGNEVINASGLTHNGTYYVRVTAENNTKGEYFLDPPASVTTSASLPPAASAPTASSGRAIANDQALLAVLNTPSGTANPKHSLRAAAHPASSKITAGSINPKVTAASAETRLTTKSRPAHSLTGKRHS